MSSVRQTTTLLWATRIILALVIGAGLDSIVHSESLSQFIGFIVGTAVTAGLILLWLKVLEELVEEERANPGIDMDELSP